MPHNRRGKTKARTTDSLNREIALLEDLQSQLAREIATAISEWNDLLEQSALPFRVARQTSRSKTHVIYRQTTKERLRMQTFSCLCDYLHQHPDNPPAYDPLLHAIESERQRFNYDWSVRDMTAARCKLYLGEMLDLAAHYKHSAHLLSS